ncbi:MULTISPECIES: TRAP transporter permease [Ureibacillus]|jgi:TRAP transporter 4TM/12TM fusion protein|uniref:TRAP transporter 4TM/12TM fusion protein n=1 Tax=Ureibacillus thermosphaericus TaxID=51173 RepID=A0A840PW11_URETH|nr:TRAP transporter permease [Ureibacillus thermosphaericus]MBB5150070.1 TRAP transporter 4TM/12TM fusion protein [Ureibacillus thermosphaericus]NKZ32692.1 TRAP transporter permease [Ureibacillus thermosphaericus]
MATDKQLEVLTEEQQQEILEKYDTESNVRRLGGVMKWIVFGLLLAFSLFQLYTAIFGQFTAYIQRSIHLGFGLTVIFLLFPARKKASKTKIPFYDYLLAIIAAISGMYWTLNYQRLVTSLGKIDQMDFIVGTIVILLVLEAARRAVGLPITIIASLFLVYAFFGPYMPDFLAHRGQSLEQIVNLMYFSTDGILGTPISVSATYIFAFLLFGAFLVKTGVGSYFNDLAITIAGKLIGGPAKVAVFSSALQGTISGSSVANVVTSGSYTIPLMKKLGYKKEFAGAVEAAASTGGQLMPPIMGAAAFLMVEFIGRGITYWEIAKAAIIPAILYFSGIWIMTHFEAKKMGLRGLTDEEIPNRKEIFKKLYLLIPILLIIVLMMTGIPVIHAALYGILSCIIIGFINKEVEFGVKDIIEALVDGARTALAVVAATACAGIIVGVVVKTGLGLSLANSLVKLAGGSILLTLFFVMIASLILGMGAPTTANYVITSTIAAPAIVALLAPDVPQAAVPLVVMLSAHFFVFYFGIIADITPPVALAAFAASGISGGDPIKTGVNSAKLAIAAFIIPYMIVFSPALLMIDVTFLEVIWVVFTAMMGMIAIGAGVIGYWYRKINWIERIIVILAGLAMIYPESMSDLIGLIVFGIMFAIQLFTKNKGNNTKLDASIN